MGREFSDTVIDHFKHPRHVVPLPWPDGTAWAKDSSESKYIRIQVCLAEDCIQAIAFGTYGCAPAIACGSWVCEWAHGKTVEAVNRLTPAMVLDALGGLPEHRRVHADLSVRALHEAVSKALAHLACAPQGGTP